MLQDVLQTIDSHREAAVAGLKDFLKIPSVSANPKQSAEMTHCAEWLSQRLSASGLDSKVMPTRGHPAVVARNRHQPGRPTVLFYGHYDVQPPEPLELWTTPPFEPAVRNGALFARGSADDKGQVWAHVQAISAWQHHGGAPVNLILLIEGEEEIGSINLAEFVTSNRNQLKADLAVISDTNQFARGVPAINYALRGLVYMEVVITGTGHDLHSGLYGGAVPNAANVLCELLATLHDRDGRVNIPGFYDGVLPLSADERQMWQGLPFDEKAFLKEVNIPFSSGEAGYSILERIWARPTCDINGLTSGYQGPGAKTVIASKASAKISMRLVPDQDPKAIIDSFRKTLGERCPKGVTIEIEEHSHAPAVLVPMRGPAMEFASEAYEIGFGVRPALIRGGGSIPVVGLIKSILGIDTLLVGFGLPDDRVHSPNEKFELDALYGGTRTAAALYDRLSRMSPLS